jgi:hypothetical protein
MSSPGLAVAEETPASDDLTSDPIVQRAVELFNGRITAVQRKV